MVGGVYGSVCACMYMLSEVGRLSIGHTLPSASKLIYQTTTTNYNSLTEAALARVAQELHATVDQVRRLPPGRERRGRHDDITVVVLFFEEERQVGARGVYVYVCVSGGGARPLTRIVFRSALIQRPGP